MPALRAATSAPRARTTSAACSSTTAIRARSTSRCSIRSCTSAPTRPTPAWCRILEYYCPQCGTMIETEYLPPGHPPLHDIELDIDALKVQWKDREELRRPRPQARLPSVSRTCTSGKPGMKRVSVDIGGTFTDCFVAWDERYVEAQGADHAPQPRARLQRGAGECLRGARARRCRRCSRRWTRCATRRRSAPTR